MRGSRVPATMTKTFDLKSWLFDWNALHPSYTVYIQGEEFRNSPSCGL